MMNVRARQSSTDSKLEAFTQLSFLIKRVLHKKCGGSHSEGCLLDAIALDSAELAATSLERLVQEHQHSLSLSCKGLLLAMAAQWRRGQFNLTGNIVRQIMSSL